MVALLARTFLLSFIHLLVMLLPRCFLNILHLSVYLFPLCIHVGDIFATSLFTCVHVSRVEVLTAITTQMCFSFIQLSSIQRKTFVRKREEKKG